MRRLKIREKLILGFTICVALSVVVGVVAISHLVTIKKNTAEVRIAAEIEKDILECRRQEKNILLFGPHKQAVLEGEKEESYLEKIEGNLENLKKLIKQGQTIAAEEEEEFLGILTEIGSYEVSLKEVVSDYDKGEAAIDDHILSMRKNARKVQETARKIIKIAEVRIESAHTRARNITLLMLALAVLFGEGVAFGLSRNILIPIRKLAAATLELAKGNLRQRVEIESKDEIGELAQAFNKMGEDLEKSQKELTQIYNGSPSGMRVVDKDLNIVSQNEAMSELSGIDKAKAKGMKCYEQLKGALCDTEDCTLRQILKGKELVDVETEKIRPDGEHFPCRVLASPFKDIAGNIKGIIEIFVDISDLKRLAQKEKELAVAAAAAAARKKAEELASMNEELETANEEAQKAKEAAEKKAEQLERFNKVAVDRELKMRELKEKIAELEGKLKSREPWIGDRKA